VEQHYEALGIEFRHLDIVRDGQLEATNYLFGFSIWSARSSS
jgi:hypothetical protein